MMVCIYMSRKKQKMIGRSQTQAISIWQRNNKDNHAEERQHNESWGKNVI